MSNRPEAASKNDGTDWVARMVMLGIGCVVGWFGTVVHIYYIRMIGR